MRYKFSFASLFVIANVTAVSQTPVQPSSEIGNDVAVAMAVAPNGDLFMTGYSKIGKSGYDFETIKYDRDGRLLWSRRFDGAADGDDRPSAISLDARENVYVTGSSAGAGSGSDYLTMKYDASGDLKWSKRFNGSANGSDHPTAMFVSPEGKVWVTGYSSSKATGFDVVTINYDTDGAEIWKQTYNGPTNGDDYGVALEADPTGNCYIAGYSRRTSKNSTYLLIKYDPSGKADWIRNYGENRNQNARATALTLTSKGAICVAGFAEGRHADTDIVTVSYDSTGKELWSYRYDGPFHGDDKPTGIQAQISNGTIVIGASSGSDSGKDYLTLDLDENGKLIWQSRYNGSGDGDDVPVGATVLPDGSVWVTGYSLGTGSGTDIVTLAYSASGKESNTIRYNGAGNDVDRPIGIASDASGNIYVAGYSWGGKGQSFDYVAIKYSPAGALIWERRFDAMSTQPG